MSSRILVPFDNNPAAVSVKTASYTIPAGRFAKVYVEVDSGGIFTINGVNAVVTSAFANVDVYNATTTAVSYTVPTGFRAELRMLANSPTDFTISGNANGPLYVQNGNAPSNYIPESLVSLGPGSTVVSGSVNTGKSIVGVAIPSNATNRQAEFYLPTGTVISGSGNWRATVQEYNLIS